MYLKRLALTNFKNYGQSDFTFSERINCFVGNNSVGKTNLLDAVHYLSFCKSYFTSNDAQNIRHGEEFFAINGTYFRGSEIPEQVQCIQKKNTRKHFSLNRKEYDRLADHIGNFPLVMISPYDNDLINEGSDVRRKYTDSVICQFDKLYLDDLINYNKSLAQRNALLKSFADGRYFDLAALEIWDEQLVALGQRIYDRRKEFLAQFIPVFRHYFAYISGASETVDIRYTSQLETGAFRDLLSDARKRDQAAQYSTTGIHKDDLEFAIGGYPVKKFGSQGQQKSFVIAIKLAQFEYTRKIKGFKPILLLDDIFDKLDDLRVQQLIKLVGDHSFGQVFLTDTSETRMRSIFDAMDIDHLIFEISARDKG